jgi:hypothetical protein
MERRAVLYSGHIDAPILLFYVYPFGPLCPVPSCPALTWKAVEFTVIQNLYLRLTQRKKEKNTGVSHPVP